MKNRNHTTHSACKEILKRDGVKAVGCCCTGHECKRELEPEEDKQECECCQLSRESCECYVTEDGCVCIGCGGTQTCAKQPELDNKKQSNHTQVKLDKQPKTSKDLYMNNTLQILEKERKQAIKAKKQAEKNQAVVEFLWYSAQVGILNKVLKEVDQE